MNCSSRIDSNIDVGSLWNDLDLGKLLDIKTNVVDEMTTNYLQQSACPSTIAREKYKKMVEKPTFNVLMGRYQALPHDPICIDSKVIDRLADPIRGRFGKYDELNDGSQFPEVKYSSPNRARSKSPPRSPGNLMRSMAASGTASGNRQSRQVDDMGGFFLTETGEETNPNPNADIFSYLDEEKISAANAQKHEIYARVKEILSPKKISQQSKPFIPPKYRDPLLNAVRKTMRQKKHITSEKKFKSTKFTLNGIDSKAQRRGGKMLHATQVKPLPKDKAEELIKSRKHWIDKVVPTELLHSKINQAEQRAGLRERDRSRNKPAQQPTGGPIKIGPIRRSLSAGKRTRISYRDNDNLMPVDPEMHVVDQIDDVLGIKKPKSRLFPNIATRQIQNEENERQRILMRSKSSAQLRVDKIERVVASRNPLVPGVAPTHKNERQAGRVSGIRSAPSLLVGLQRVDEHPLHKHDTGAAKLKSNGASAQPTGSTVRRKLISDIMAADRAASDISETEGSQRYRKSGPPRLTPIGVNNFMPVPEYTSPNETHNVSKSGKGAISSKQDADAGDNMGTFPTQTNEDPYVSKQEMSVPLLPRRTTAEIYNSLEKIAKEKSAVSSGAMKYDPSSKQQVRATKGTAAGTAEIEADMQEKQVEKLMQFTKRFQSQLATAESISAEYITLRNGGVTI